MSFHFTRENKSTLLRLIRQATHILDLPGDNLFPRFMKELVGIGDYLGKITENILTKDRKTRDQELLQMGDKGESVESILTSLLKNNTNKINNMYAFRAFESAWEDMYFEPQEDLKPDPAKNKDRRTLILKAGINASVRRKISLALHAITQISLNDHEPDFIADRDPIKAAKITKEASDAITSYKTPRQKSLTWFGRILTGLAALTFGITTGAAVLVTFPVSSFILFAAASIFVAGSLVNWMIFSNPVYNFLNDLFGKDNLFEGLTHYVNDKGVKTELKGLRKAALGAALLLATSVGLAMGALTYTSVVGLSGAVAALGIGAAFLPPVAIALAAVACVCLTALMFKSFASMLKKDDLKSSFTAPFKKVADIFDENLEQNSQKSPTRLKWEKGITFIAVGVLTLVGFASLVMASLASTSALNAFLTTNVLGSAVANAATIATAVSYSVGMGLAFVGQIPFLLEAIALTVANIATQLRNFVHRFAKAPDNMELKQKGMEEILEEQRGVDARALDTLGSLGSFSLKVINAVGNGVLVIPSLLVLLKTLIAEPLAILFAQVSGIGAGLNSLSAGISSSAPPSKDDLRKVEASTARMRRLLPSNEQNEEADYSPVSIPREGNKENKEKKNTSLRHYFGKFSSKMLESKKAEFERAKKKKTRGEGDLDQPRQQPVAVPGQS